MIVLLGKELKDFEGTTIDSTPTDSTPVTAGKIATNALLATFQDEPQLSGEDKLLRWELAVKIKNTPDPIELTAEEISLIKKLVGKAYSPMIVGQTWKILEGEK